MVEISFKELPLLAFSSLYNLLREEKRLNEKLQKLDELFYEALDKFFLEKEKEIKRLESVDDDKLKKEKKIYSNSRKIVSELLSLRLQKISMIAIENQMVGEEIFSEENIVGKEKIFLEQVKKTTQEFK